MKTKKCSRCGETKSLDKFSKDNRYALGVKGQCKRCLQDLKTIRYHNDPQKYRKKMNDYLKRTPELLEKRRIRACIVYLEERGYKVML